MKWNSRAIEPAQTYDVAGNCQLDTRSETTMKTVAALTFALTTFAAQAQNINLMPTSCTGTCSCSAVNNDALAPDGSALSIEHFSYSTYYKRMTMSIEGKLWDSGLWAATSSTKVQLYDGLGGHITVTADFKRWSTLHRSGHNYYVQHCALTSGTVTGL